MITRHSAMVAATFLIVVSLGSDALAMEADELRGSWKAVSAELEGKPMSMEASPVMTLADGKILGPDGKEALTAVPAPDGKEVPVAASYRTDSTKEPKELDFIYAMEHGTVTMRAIYKIEKDQLTICMSPQLAVEDQKVISKRPADFASGPGKFIVLYRRAKEGDKAPEKADGGRDMPERKEQRERSAAAIAAEKDIIDRIAKAGGYAEFDPLRPKEGIKVVKLQGKDITDAQLALVKDLTEVEGLVLTGSSVTDEGLAHVANLKELEGISLAGTKVTGKGLIHLRGLKKLQVLDLGHTKVGDEGLAHLQSLPALRSLHLNSTKVTDAGLAEVGKCERLTHLNLYATDVGDAGLAKLANLHEILDLTLSETQVTDAGLKHLHGMKKLVHVGASDTSITAEGAMDLQKALPEVNVGR